MGFYMGYTWFYNPMERKFTQARAIGEETLATRGFNFNAAPLCMGGNYSKIPNTQLTVDPMYSYMEEDIAKFLLDLINGNHNWVVLPVTEIDLSLTRVHPHRRYQHDTACYGSGLTDDWITGILSKYSYNKNTEQIQERIKTLRYILSLYLKLFALFKQQSKMSLASLEERTCTGIVY